MKTFGMNRISLKLGLLFSGIFLALLIMLGYILYGLFSKMFIEYISQELLIHGQNHSKILEENFTQETLNNIVLTEKNLTTNVVITDNKKNILVSSEQITDEMFAFIANKEKYQESEILNNDWKNNPNIATVSPINSGELGYVYMFYFTESLKEIVFILKFLIIVASIGIIFIAIGIIALISSIMTKPLLIMKNATNEMARGKYKQEFNISGKDEISQLAKSIQELGTQLHYYENTRNEFLTDLSHELRTPLTYIQGYSDVLLKNLVSDKEEQKNYLKIIRDETKRVNHLVEDLFELSKIQTGQLKVTITTANIIELLINSINILTPLASNKNIKLIFEKEADSILAKVDPIRMEQVFFNIIDNAIKYTEKGYVKISVKSSKGTISIMVEDTGIGIPKEDIPKIWNRFYRVEKSRSRKTGGSGLGLHIVKEIIGFHQGSIDINSEEGKGTTVTIKLKSEEVIK